MKHAINWVEIPVEQFDRAKKFYETILNFEMNIADLGILKMGFLPHDTGAIGAAICRHPEFYKPSDKGSLIYLNGEPDLQPILNRVEFAGGKVILQKRLISETLGFMGLFLDSEGNRIGIRSME